METNLDLLPESELLDSLLFDFHSGLIVHIEWMRENMTLNERQFQFMEMLPLLLLWLKEHGYGVAGAELYRTPEQALLNERNGTGIRNSLHCVSLAIDLRLFQKDQNGRWKYLSQTEDYLEAGEYWESLGGSWGGRFTRKDGCHFSLDWDGRQ